MRLLLNRHKLFVLRLDLRLRTCNFCGHKGHYESHCRKKEAARAAAMSRAPHAEGERDRMITCHTCGVVGHLSTTCPNRGFNIPGPLNGQGNA